MTFELNNVPRIFELEGHVSDKKGTLYAIEDFHLGVDIKRVFYITDFANQTQWNNRGNHSHALSSQFIINIKGRVDIKLVDIDTLTEYNFVLDSPRNCLYLPPNFHIFMNSYSEDSVMLVLCDKSFEDDKINHYYLPESLDGFREAASYLNTPLKDIIDKYNALHQECQDRMKFKHLSEMEFNELFGDRTPKPDELINFYKNTNNYILELTEYHSTIARHNMTNDVIQQIKQLKLENILDYGCGIGEDSIQLLESGINTTLCDIAGKTYDFAKWRLKNRGFSPAIVEITENEENEAFKDTYFDAIMCFEVIMHVPEPLATLKLLYSRLRDGGYLFLTHRFIDNYSLALEQNQYLHHEIKDILSKVGFTFAKEMPVWPGKNLYLYKK